MESWKNWFWVESFWIFIGQNTPLASKVRVWSCNNPSSLLADVVLFGFSLSSFLSRILKRVCQGEVFTPLKNFVPSITNIGSHISFICSMENGLSGSWVHLTISWLMKKLCDCVLLTWWGTYVARDSPFNLPQTGNPCLNGREWGGSRKRFFSR